MAEYNPYLARVKKHLEDHRPKERQALQDSGDLESHVDDLADSLDEGVENYRQAYLKKNPVPKGANFVETARHLNHAKQIAEEVMTREYLPWDEEQLAEIGPSGGYED